MRLCDKCGIYIDRKYADEVRDHLEHSEHLTLKGFEFDLCWDCNKKRRDEIDKRTNEVNRYFMEQIVNRQSKFRDEFGSDGIPIEEE